MTALVCGSYAFDTIMVFPEQFKNHILPDKVHMLNVAFLVPELRKEFGGCAGNIAYNLKLLGADALGMGTVGKDFGPYRDRLTQLGIDDRYVKEIADQYTAQAYITTDMDDNQITAFHPGAMNEAQIQSVPADGSISIGMVSPDGRQGMIEHAEQFKAAGIPFVFDPGQGLPMFDGDDLKHFIALADWVIVNDYEAQMLSERTGLAPGDIARQLLALIVTRGGEGSLVYTADGRIDIPVAPVDKLSDPTGCGDAYRAGLLYGLMQGWDWPQTGRLGALLGALKIAQAGTQNHHFDRTLLAQRWAVAFGDEAPSSLR